MKGLKRGPGRREEEAIKSMSFCELLQWCPDSGSENNQERITGSKGGIIYGLEIRLGWWNCGIINCAQIKCGIINGLKPRISLV